MSADGVVVRDSASIEGAEKTASLTPTECASELLAAYRTEDDPDPYLARLAAVDDGDLRSIREDRGDALAFWLNLYNAGTQRLLARRPSLYESRLRTVRFFRAPCLAVAGTTVSLDLIEHGILRRSRSKYGLGYLPSLFVESFEHRYRLADPDPRVHFALNCGAASCPAIRVYDSGHVDDQLRAATRSYLESTVEYDPDAETATVPRVFLWYRGDFGGGAGIKALLRDYGAIPDGAAPRLRYRSWDWSRTPGKFADG